MSLRLKIWVEHQKWGWQLLKNSSDSPLTGKWRYWTVKTETIPCLQTSFNKISNLTDYFSPLNPFVHVWIVEKFLPDHVIYHVVLLVRDDNPSFKLVKLRRKQKLIVNQQKVTKYLLQINLSLFSRVPDFEVKGKKTFAPFLYFRK